MKTKTKKKTGKAKKARPAIPDNVKLKIWNDSGGRCEFRGCNKPLWYNELTFNGGNFAKLAHIIGASGDGPRGGKKSEELQKDSSNIMLLCPTCHDEIDDKKLLKNYPTKFLIGMKKEHESRIKSVTEIKHNRKTEILIFKANIDKRFVDINAAETKQTIIQEKYYPNGKGHLLDYTFGKGDGDLTYWALKAAQIEERIKEDFVKKGIDENKVEHLSIFALAPIPLLIILGKAVSDTFFNKVDLYQRHRDTQDWHWKKTKEKLSPIKVIKPQRINPKNQVVLVVSISDHIAKDKYPNNLKDNSDVYEITIDGIPTPHFLKRKEQLIEFEKCFREVLNEIQKLHGKETEIHLLSAMPAPFAIKCGMTFLPKKDAPLVLYDFNKVNNGMRKVLTIR